MSRQAFSMIAIACALRPPCDSRVMAWSVALLRPISRGSMPITTSANLRMSAVRPPAPYPSLYSAQPTRPSSVTIFRNENTRQPASACSCSKRAIFINLGLSVVMAGLVPAIHDLLVSEDVDARHKAGHDGGEVRALRHAATSRPA